MLPCLGRLWSDTWIPEYVAVGLSSASMAAIVAILAAYNGQNVANWHFPYDININAVVSVLNTVSKTLLAFAVSATLGQWKWINISRKYQKLDGFALIDSASRGPLGSLQLLWETKGATIMSIGALMTILSLASDPFVQQIIKLGPRTVSTTNPLAHITRAGSYSLGTQSQPDVSMILAITQGFGANDTKSRGQVTFGCPSGDCTWNPFTSLGICSSCHNLSSLLNETHTPASFNNPLALQDRYYNTTTFGFRDTALTNIDTGNTYQDSSSGWYNRPSYSNGSYSLMVFGFSDHIENDTDPLQIANDTISFKTLDSDLFIVSYPLIKVRRNGQNVAMWPRVEIDAVECGLRYCIQEIHPQVNNGTLHETVLELPTKVHSRSTSFTQTPLQFYVDARDDEIFAVSQATTSGIKAFLDGFFNPASIEGEDPNFIPDISGSMSSVIGYPNGSNLRFDNPNVEALYYSENLNETFANAAIAMSTHIRENADKRPIVIGAATTVETTVSIHWAWITLPVGIVLLGAFFVVVTTWRSSRLGMPTWKEGQLPVILHALEANPKRTVRTPAFTTSTSMNQYARSVHARMYGTNNGFTMATIEPRSLNQPNRRDVRGGIGALGSRI